MTPLCFPGFRIGAVSAFLQVESTSALVQDMLNKLLSFSQPIFPRWTSSSFATFSTPGDLLVGSLWSSRDDSALVSGEQGPFPRYRIFGRRLGGGLSACACSVHDFMNASALALSLLIRFVPACIVRQSCGVSFTPELDLQSRAPCARLASDTSDLMESFG